MPGMRDQILVSLCEWFEQYAGEPIAVDPETNLVDWLRQNKLWDGFDFCDLIFAIEHTFGVRISHQEWMQFLNQETETAKDWEQFVKPRLTFSALVDFIAEHVQPVSFKPVDICLRPCAEAGAFLGLRQIAQQLGDATGHIAPSTPIIDVLQKRNLDLFWTRVRWHTDGVVAPLSFPHRRWGQRLICAGLLGILGTIASIVRKQVEWLFACLEATASTFRAGAALHWAGNPLPKDIQTFRDLAELIAQSQTARATTLT